MGDHDDEQRHTDVPPSTTTFDAIALDLQQLRAEAGLPSYSEIVLRIYLTIGFIALVGLIALAVTSTDAMIRHLGARWNTLHKIVYAIAILGIIHFMMQTKVDITEAVMVAGFLFWLLGYRLMHRYVGPVTSIWQIALTLIAAALTALAEAGWYGATTDVTGLPFDESSAVVPNRDGRVIDPVTGSPIAGAYVAGWIKRGPTGFIGTNKSCSMQTVSNLVDDFNAGLLGNPDVRSASLDKLVRSRQPDVVDARGWRAIDAAETARGDAEGRARVKFTDVSEMVAVAAAAPEPPLARRLLAGLLR